MRYFDKLKQFDKVTEFRLQNAFLVAIGMSILAPILISLKGLLLLPWIISAFAIAQALAVKTNNWFITKLNLDQFLKTAITFHIIFIMVAGSYFYSPELMVWLSSITAVIEITIFSAYSIVLNNYLTDNYPSSMSKFQVMRNSIWSDGYLIGLVVVGLATFFSTLGTAVVIFMTFNTFFSFWLIKHWNFYINVK